MARGHALRRQWSLVETLSSRQRGMRVADLIGVLGSSRSTIYRDIAALRDAGVPLETHNINGEARVTLHSPLRLPPLSPTPLQVAALRLAQRGLAGLAGTAAARELDALLAGYAREDRKRPATTSLARTRAVAPDRVERLDRAILSGRRCRIRYRGSRDAAPRARTLDPVGLRWVKGHLYLVAYDVSERGTGPKTFKLDRITSVDSLRDTCSPRPVYDDHAVFARSIKAWTGDEHDVAIRLDRAVARFAHEYRLIADQTLADQPDGSVLVRARVAGLQEALRWVLSWGQAAEALEPLELRQLVRDELEGAVRHYRRARNASAARITKRSDRPTQAGTRGR